MSHTTYPTATDLIDFLLSGKMISEPPTDQQYLFNFEEAMASAIAMWERGTGWIPFLAETQTRTYDPPGPEKGPVGIYVGVNNLGGARRMFLYAGLLALTTLKVGVTLTNAGSALTVNRDFWLRPQNALNWKRPYTYIEFGYPQWGNPQSITLLGSYGYCTIIPDDAWYTILKIAAMEVLPLLHHALFAGIKRWTEADVTEEYPEKPYLFVFDTWRGQIDSVMGRYARKNIV